MELDTVSDFSVGSVLSRTWTILWQNSLIFFGLLLIAELPTIIVSFSSPQEVGMALLIAILNLVLTLVIQGAVAYAVFQSLTGETASFGEALSRGLSRAPTMLLAGLLTGLCLVIGVILLIIPGIIVGCMLAVTMQACVVERLGAMASLSRSVELTKDYRLLIFGLFLIIGFATFVIAMVATVILQHAWLVNIVATIPNAFASVMMAVIYFDLRSVKEGLNLDSLANVFD